MAKNELDVIILSKSSKHHKYCVAGIDIKSGEFVRLNSDDEIAHGALGLQDMVYGDGSICSVLDIARVCIKGKRPLATQPENVLIDSLFCWQKLGESSLPKLHKYLSSSPRGLIFGTNTISISEDQAISCKRSLELIKATDIYFYKLQSSNGQYKSRIDFKFNGTEHKSYYMTDPSYYSAKDGTRLQEAIMLISIPDGAQYFKFVSKIFY